MKDYISDRVLWYKFIKKKETIADYREGISYLELHGYNVLGIVSDGLKGLRQEFYQYRLQQMLVIRIPPISFVTSHLYSDMNKPTLETKIVLLALYVIRPIVSANNSKNIIVYSLFIILYIFHSVIKLLLDFLLLNSPYTL